MSNFNKNFFATARKEKFLRTVPRSFLELIVITSACIFLIYFTLDQFEIKNHLSSLGIYLLATYRTFPAVNRILTHYQRLKFSTPFINNIKKQFDDDKNFQNEPKYDDKKKFK